jgi:hypothetical protein
MPRQNKALNKNKNKNTNKNKNAAKVKMNDPKAKTANRPNNQENQDNQDNAVAAARTPLQCRPLGGLVQGGCCAELPVLHFACPCGALIGMCLGHYAAWADRAMALLAPKQHFKAAFAHLVNVKTTHFHPTDLATVYRCPRCPASMRHAPRTSTDNIPSLASLPRIARIDDLGKTFGAAPPMELVALDALAAAKDAAKDAAAAKNASRLAAEKAAKTAKARDKENDAKTLAAQAKLAQNAGGAFLFNATLLSF